MDEQSMTAYHRDHEGLGDESLDSSDLLSCPFCGGKADQSRVHELTHPHVVQCGQCKAMAGGSRYQNDEWNAKKWNQRAG